MLLLLLRLLPFLASVTHNPSPSLIVLHRPKPFKNSFQPCSGRPKTGARSQPVLSSHLNWEILHNIQMYIELKILLVKHPYYCFLKRYLGEDFCLFLMKILFNFMTILFFRFSLVIWDDRSGLIRVLQSFVAAWPYERPYNANQVTVYFTITTSHEWRPIFIRRIACLIPIP
jgi:hypothetical protein